MTLFRARERLERQHAREIDRLLGIIEAQNDKIMLLAGNPWTLPPRPDQPEIERFRGDPDEAYTASPEQHVFY